MISVFEEKYLLLTNTIKTDNGKLFEKQQKGYYHKVFTIQEVIYVVSGLKSSHKKFTIARLFTIDQFTIARLDCTAHYAQL